MKTLGLGAGQQDTSSGTNSVHASQKSFRGSVDFQQSGRRIDDDDSEPRCHGYGSKVAFGLAFTFQQATDLRGSRQMRRQTPEQLKGWIVEYVRMTAPGESDGG